MSAARLTKTDVAAAMSAARLTERDVAAAMSPASLTKTDITAAIMAAMMTKTNVAAAMSASRLASTNVEAVDTQITTDVAAVDMQSTTDVAAADMQSTIVGPSSDNDEVETMRPDSSRTSKSRTSAARSSGTKERKRLALLAHAKMKALASGREWVEPKPIEEHRDEQRAAMLHHVPMVDRGSVVVTGSVIESMTPEQLIGTILDKADKRRITLEERMAHLAALEQFCSPDFVQKPRYRESEDMVDSRYIVDKDSCLYCLLCSKYNSVEHRASQMRKAPCSEAAACDEMLGCCSRARRFSDGLKSPMSKESFRNYWGKDVEAMPKILMDRLSKRLPHRDLHAPLREEEQDNNWQGRYSVIGPLRGYLPGKWEASHHQQCDPRPCPGVGRAPGHWDPLGIEGPIAR